MNKILILLALVMSLSGCHMITSTKMDDNAHPRFPNWKLDKQYSNGDAPLRSDVVYLHAYADDADHLRGKYRGYRFFPNGQAYSFSTGEKQEVIEQLSAIKNGIIGYYIKTDDKMSSEFFVRGNFSFFGTGYAISHYHFNEDGTFTRYETGLRGDGHWWRPMTKFKNPQTYIPTPLPDDANANANW